MIAIPLTGYKANGRVALIDDEDYELVSRRSWAVDERIRPGARSIGPYARASTRAGGKTTVIRMHKLITGWPLTDHIDGNGLNNQRSNLRPATFFQNSVNRRSAIGSSSQYLGVYWNTRFRRWIATVQFQGKIHHVGTFADEEAAARARDALAIELHGEYAHLNFPEVRSA